MSVCAAYWYAVEFASEHVASAIEAADVAVFRGAQTAVWTLCSSQAELEQRFFVACC